MKGSSFFLRTKLLPPRAAPELLDRPRLTERLRANLTNPVTMVAADAGSGKTTLVADFVRGLSMPLVWYQLDHTDADPAVFLGYIAHGIREIEPDFGDAIFEYLSEGGEDALRYPERAADLLINEILRSVQEPFVLVLDDYHHIGRETAVHKIVDRMVQYSSDLFHLMITTRDLPPLAMTRRRSQSAALVITRNDLLFNDDEVRGLFRQTLKIDLNDNEVVHYRERTRGWITALQLVRQAAEQTLHSGSGDRPIDLREELRHSERDIFDYFVEEVFAGESEETQHLLMRLSLLESLDLETCGRLFPELRPSAALPELAQKNVFLTVAGNGGAVEEYRFHPLFRDFLRRRLRSEIGKAALAEEQNRIAEYFVAERQWETALSYLLDAQNFDRAAAVIAETGGEWIAAGAFNTLSLFAGRVPAESLEKFPRSLLYLGEIARLEGEFDRSSGLLTRAGGLLNAVGDAAGEADALHSLASLARRRRKFSDAFALLEKAEKLAEPDAETFIKIENTRGLCHIVSGNWTEAERHFRLALSAAEKQANERYVRLVTHNLALAPGFRGDFGEALRWFKRIFRGQPEKQLPQEAIGHLNVARLHLYRGEFDDTEKHLERALELCQLYNLRSIRPEIFEAYGNLYREKADPARAEEFYERAAIAYEAAEIDVTTKELDEERAAFYFDRGDAERARKLLERLIAVRLEHGNTAGVHTARLRLFQIDIVEGKTDGLAEAVNETLTFFRDQGQFYYEAIASVLLAQTHFAAGRIRDAVEPVRRALDLSARFDYDYWLRAEIRRYPQVFGIEEIAERLPEDLRKELDAAPPEHVPASSPAIAAAPITDLSVRVLGHVEIFRDPEKPFASDAWTTRRARDIFCYIATSKHLRVAKDVLIEAFWPGEDPAVIEKNFHPTISHIRKALNSRQALKQNFIVFRDGAYQLNPELSYSIDAEDFERHITEAEIAKREKDATAFRRSLEAAYALYRGEFMTGVYDEWAEERRGFYTEQFGRVLSALAKLAFGEKRWSAALKYAGEVLKDDPFREDMHRLTMKTFAAQSKPAAVKKHFEDLVAMLDTEMGIKPAAETRRLYQDLMK